MWVTSTSGCAIILSWVVHRGLRPLEELRSQMEHTDAESLDRSFAVDGSPAELEPVIDQLNGFVGRIRQVFEREQAFAAAAAHELRTPLAGLRSTLEVTLARPREAEELREAAGDCLDITLRMQTIVESLLELARLGSAESAPQTDDRVVVRDAVSDAFEPLAGARRRRGLDLETIIDEDLTLRTNRRLFQRVIDNLADNAVRYADDTDSIRVEARRTRNGIAISVSNDATDAPADLPERAFDAFWRADSVRTGGQGHVGLGLALCRRIVEKIGGTIGARLERGRFVVEVTGLPAAPAPAEAPTPA